jgi:hypothetical protein
MVFLNAIKLREMSSFLTIWAKTGVVGLENAEINI